MSHLSLQIVNLPWLNQIDLEWLRSQVAPFDYIFTIDNHYLSGGQGEKIASALSELNLKNPPLLKRFGLNEIPACGTNVEALRYHGLDSFQLCEKICMEIMSIFYISYIKCRRRTNCLSVGEYYKYSVFSGINMECVRTSSSVLQ